MSFEGAVADGHNYTYIYIIYDGGEFVSFCNCLKCAQRKCSFHGWSELARKLIELDWFLWEMRFVGRKGAISIWKCVWIIKLCGNLTVFFTNDDSPVMRGCRFSRGLLLSGVADVGCCAECGWGCCVDRVDMMGLAAAVMTSEMCALVGLSEVSDSSEVELSSSGYDRFERSARSSSRSSRVGWRRSAVAQDWGWLGRTWAARLSVYICGISLVGGTRSHKYCLWLGSG